MFEIRYTGHILGLLFFIGPCFLINLLIKRLEYYFFMFSLQLKAGRVWTAPFLVPVVRGVWAVIRHAYAATEQHVTPWMAPVLVLPGGEGSTVTSPAL